MASETILVYFFFFFLLVDDQAQCVGFIFNGFNGSEGNFTLERVSIIKPSGLLRLTNRTQNATGHAFYSKPIQMKNTSSLSSKATAASFSTYFVFAIVPPDSGRGGFGFAFALAPTRDFRGGTDGHYLGLFNPSNDGEESNHVFAVEFDTVNGFNDRSDSEGNHVGININSMNSSEVELAFYYRGTSSRKEEIALESGKPIQAWVEYDGIAKVVKVTICPIDEKKPIKPLITHKVDLTLTVKDTMYAGFSASTGAKASSHYILGWSFAMNGRAAQPLNLARLPMPPSNEKDSSSSFKPSIIALIVALCVVTVLLLGILFSVTVYKTVMRHETLEDWELDCPHRFRYRDLYAATKGFKASEILGIGGFGSVYKAVLPSNGNEVAVKKITRNNSLQGLREFVAEIESLGRLRHKNLVNLQGWCKHKNDLLLVYDYIPNGSLDSLLFYPKNNHVLSWRHRFKIVRGITAGLLYLHEEWEQVVIHRDVKSSNVLIDAEMKARLGDFGLARLYDHGTLSHTTNVVGTVGYIAPEMARTGKASASSDVYAYGVLLLEVATGRRPIDSGQFLLVDWVMELQQLDRILEAVDPKMRIYVVEEIELVLMLGLFCSHQRPELRPTMRQVMRYLNGDEKLPSTVDDGSNNQSRRLNQMNSKLSEFSGITTTSYCSSSIGGLSTTSIDAGR